MLPYFIALSFFTLIYAFEPSCSSCKFYIPHNNGDTTLGLCKIFKNTPYNNKDIIIYDYASHCRNNESLCGKGGLLYEQSDVFFEKKLLDDYEDIKNRCCGEVNEKDDIDELEKLEKEFFEIFQKIKKHNTKRIYKSAKDMYKLFKNKKN